MKHLALGIAAAGLLAGVSMAQTTLTTPNSSTDRTTLPRTEGVGVNRSDNGNAAVATTMNNAAQPAKGANSFTMGEAKSRIEKNGFSDVSDLKKDDGGVWRGSAKKNGTTTNVWLDYKGNTGTGS